MLKTAGKKRGSNVREGRLLKAGLSILWIIMIGVSLLLASRSLMI